MEIIGAREKLIAITKKYLSGYDGVDILVEKIKDENLHIPIRGVLELINKYCKDKLTKDELDIFDEIPYNYG